MAASRNYCIQNIVKRINDLDGKRDQLEREKEQADDRATNMKNRMRNVRLSTDNDDKDLKEAM